MSLYLKRLLSIIMLSQIVFCALSYGSEIEIHPEEKPYLDALMKRLNIDRNKIVLWKRLLDEKNKKRTDYYKVIGDFKNFYFYDNEPYQNIKFITDHENRIVYLRVSKINVGDLREIKYFSYLEWLDLHGTNIKDLKGIEYLKKLVKLDLIGSKEIKSLGDVKNLPNLRGIDADVSNNIVSVNGMENLPSLEELNCRRCEIYELSPLSSFHELETLIVGSYSENLTALKYLKNLKVLEVNSKALTDISAITNLDGLEELSIKGTKVTSLDFNKAMINLKKISFDEVPLVDLIDFTKVPNLEELLVIRSGISELNLPNNLRNLRTMYFFVNENLRIVKGLNGLENLEVVEFTRSPVDTIEINDLPKLNKLDLSGTNITKLGDFSKFPSLRELYLRDTKVKSLEAILDAPRLWLVGLDRSARDIPNVSLITQALKVNSLSREAAGDDTPTAREKYQQLLIEQKEIVKESKNSTRRRSR